MRRSKNFRILGIRTPCDGLGKRHFLPINERQPSAPEVKDKLIEHKHYIDKHGEDLPEIRNWKWSNPK